MRNHASVGEENDVGEENEGLCGEGSGRIRVIGD